MKKLISLLLLMITFGCVDRVFFDIKIPDAYGISVDGYISDQPPPYQITVLRTFDTESRENLRMGVSARVTLFDNEGNSEVCSEEQAGVYRSSANGIRGKIGGVYHIKVELDDGRAYESVPDTLFAGGQMDNLRHQFVQTPSVDGSRYEIELIAETSTKAGLTNVHFMWRNKTTFKSRANPEAEAGPPPGNCYRVPDEGRCNFVHPCTGLKNIGDDFNIVYRRIGPCTCCICWYDAYSPDLVINDNIAAVNGKFPEIVIDHVPMNGWNLMYKMRIESSIQSLSPQAHRFWRAVKNQFTAVSNLFQPITGKIPGNIRQISGPDSPAYGLFYSTSISSKYFYINREDVKEDMISKINLKAGYTPCFNMFPNSTTIQPAFWEE